MTTIDLELPCFSPRYGEKKKQIVSHWLNGKSVKKISKFVKTSEIYVAGVINEINRKNNNR